MTAQRARAYGRLMQAIGDIDPSQVTEAHCDRIRAAADSLVLCEDLHSDEGARAAIVDLEALARELNSSGRLSKRRADELVWAVLACGPTEPVLHRSAA